MLRLIISYSFLAFAFRADAMLVPVLVAVIGPRLRLNTVGAGVGALVGGIVTNIGWNLLVSEGGAAVFIGLGGSVVGCCWDMLCRCCLAASISCHRFSRPPRTRRGACRWKDNGEDTDVQGRTIG